MSVPDSSASDLLDQAVRLDRQARSNEALQLLQGCGDWPLPYNERGLLLRANILLVRDPIAVLDELPEDEQAFATHDGRVGLLIIRARAYMAARNLRPAEAALRHAESLIHGEDAKNRYLLATVRAHMSWQRREYDPSNPDMIAAMASPDPTTRLGMLNLRAWMHCGLEDYHSQLRDLVECMRMYERNPPVYHLLVVARTLQSILGLAWEMADIQAGEMASRIFESMPWTPELDSYRFLCLRGLGWHTFLAGDSERAFVFLDNAKRTAPSQAWLAMAHTDYAYVARLNGDERSAVRELEQALALVAAVDWQATRLEEKNALLTAAILLAPMDVPAAQRLLAEYDRLHAHALRTNIEFSHQPPRFYASRNYCEGLIQAALGNGPLASRLLSDAYGTFARYNFAFRAMLAAHALFEITKAERWLEAARLHAGTYPNVHLSDD